MKLLIRSLERIILRVQASLGIKHFHTVLVIILLLTNALAIALVFLVAQLAPSLSDLLVAALKLVLEVLLLGVLLGIASNYLYDMVSDTLSNPNRQAMDESKLQNYFLPDKESEKQRRTDLTVERVQRMQGEVYLLGIAATSYLPKTDDATPFSARFIDKLIRKEVTLRLILLNPYSQASKFRYAREEGIDVDAIGERETARNSFERALFCNDILNTLDKVRELKRKGAKIECRLTNFDPVISMMCTDSFVYIDILSLGRLEESATYKKQRATFPILEFPSDSPYYQIAQSHFEYHWKYAITPDELDYYKPVMKERFLSTSFTSYRLVKQHESWISIDPIVGCSLGCTYCVLKTTFQNDTQPRVYSSPESIGDALRESRFYHDDAVLCLFSYTDALLEQNKEHLIRCLEVLRQRQFRNWLCIPTKVPFDEDFARRIAESYYKQKLIFLISLSGLPRQYEPSVIPAKLIATMRMLKTLEFPVIHYWRPIIPARNCADKDIRNMLDQIGDYADCSVVAGLKASQALNQCYVHEGLIGREQQKIHGDYLPRDFMVRVGNVLREKQKSYPVYLHASCAVSKIVHQADYNGTMFRDTICSLYDTGCSFCTPEQEQICQVFRKTELDEQKCLKTIEGILPGVGARVHEHSVELLDPVYQEDLILLIHRLKHPVIARNVLYTNQYVGSILSCGGPG